MKKPQSKKFYYLGSRLPLIEGIEKISGSSKYTADLHFEGMLYARLLLSPYASAKIISINKTEAEKIDGVISVITSKDLIISNTMASRNSALLAHDEVLFFGQPVAAIIAKNAYSAEDGLEKIVIEYEPKEAVIDMNSAVLDKTKTIWPKGIPKLDSDISDSHSVVKSKSGKSSERINNVYASEKYQRGNLEKGLSAADIIVEHEYSILRIHQTYMEPHAVVAVPDPFRRNLTIYTGTQGQFLIRNEISKILGLEKDKVRIIPMTMGGGFGAKYGIYDSLAGALALTVKKTIQLIISRSEDFQSTTPSPETNIFLKTGATNAGVLTALEAKISVDSGVFGFPLASLFVSLIGGYYKIENTSIECKEINTNKPQVGAYRAPAAPQITFALESNIDELAQNLEIDPLEFRLMNAVDSGDLMGNNKPWPHHGLKNCLKTLKQHPMWVNRSKKQNEGIGIAIGGWPSFMGPASAICRIDSDGKVRIHVGSVDISGVNSSFVLVAAEELSISPDQIEIIQGDTLTGPFAPNSGGSQITYSVAGAVSDSAREVRTKLLKLASDHFEASVEDLEISKGCISVKGVPSQGASFAELAEIAQTKNGGPGPLMGQGNTSQEINAPGFTVHMAKIAIDPDTGIVKPIEYLAVHDVGFALNPTMVEGQIHGGVGQGIGIGLHESMDYDSEGHLMRSSFMDYDFPKADNLPNVTTVMIHNPSPTGPYGVRGIGEPPIIPGGAVIANAIRDATGIRFEELPIRSENLWQKLNSSKQI